MRIIISALCFSALYSLCANTFSNEDLISCNDQSYLDFVKERNAYTKNRAKTYYEKEYKKFNDTDINSLKTIEMNEYLFGNTIASARFGDKDTAIKHINLYTGINQKKLFGSHNHDAKHRISIAKGWLAYNEGDIAGATKHLYESTEVKGSPVLGSFGPDTSLIKEFYYAGHKKEVLEYLSKVSAFWDGESGKEYLHIWKIMIENDCPVLFQFYDTQFFPKLDLYKNNKNQNL